MEVKKLDKIGIFLVFALALFVFMLVTTNSTPNKEPMEIPFEYQYQMENGKPYSLDDDPNIVYWEVIDGELHIYTKADSIRDERERCGGLGRDFVLSDDAMMTAKNMCKNFISHMDTAFEKWKPKKPFKLHKV